MGGVNQLRAGRSRRGLMHRLSTPTRIEKSRPMSVLEFSLQAYDAKMFPEFHNIWDQIIQCQRCQSKVSSSLCRRIFPGADAYFRWFLHCGIVTSLCSRISALYPVRFPHFHTEPLIPLITYRNVISRCRKHCAHSVILIHYMWLVIIHWWLVSEDDQEVNVLYHKTKARSELNRFISQDSAPPQFQRLPCNKRNNNTWPAKDGASCNDAM